MDLGQTGPGQTSLGRARLDAGQANPSGTGTSPSEATRILASKAQSSASTAGGPASSLASVSSFRARWQSIMATVDQEAGVDAGVEAGGSAAEEMETAVAHAAHHALIGTSSSSAQAVLQTQISIGTPARATIQPGTNAWELDRTSAGNAAFGPSDAKTSGRTPAHQAGGTSRSADGPRKAERQTSSSDANSLTPAALSAGAALVLTQAIPQSSQPALRAQAAPELSPHATAADLSASATGAGRQDAALPVSTEGGAVEGDPSAIHQTPASQAAAELDGDPRASSPGVFHGAQQAQSSWPQGTAHERSESATAIGTIHPASGETRSNQAIDASTTPQRDAVSLAAGSSSNAGAPRINSKAEPVRGTGSQGQGAAHLLSEAVASAAQPSVSHSAGPSAALPAAVVPMSSQAGTHGASAAASAAAASSSDDPFAVLDATPTPTPSWIHASAHSAEAGYQDPSLGWVGVRAEVSGGDIHAALVPGSADAAAVLSTHLAGLNSYLAEQNTAGATVTLAMSTDSQSYAGADQSAQQQQQQQSTDVGARVKADAAMVSTSAPATMNTASALAGSTEYANPASHYISVVA